MLEFNKNNNKKPEKLQIMLQDCEFSSSFRFKSVSLRFSYRSVASIVFNDKSIMSTAFAMDFDRDFGSLLSILLKKKEKCNFFSKFPAFL